MKIGPAAGGLVKIAFANEAYFLILQRPDKSRFRTINFFTQCDEKENPIYGISERLSARFKGAQ